MLWPVLLSAVLVASDLFLKGCVAMSAVLSDLGERGCAQAGLLEAEVAEGAGDGEAREAAGVLFRPGRDDAPAPLEFHAAADVQHPLPLPLQPWLVIWRHSRFHVTFAHVSPRMQHRFAWDQPLKEGCCISSYDDDADLL